MKFRELFGNGILPPIYGVLEGHKIVPTDDIETWARFMGDTPGRRVGFDTFGDIEVSTVFLGINHGFWDNLWFETMIFNGPLDGYQARYETWEEAERGHQKAIRLLKEAMQ